MAKIMNKMIISKTKGTILASLLLLLVAIGCERSVDGLAEPQLTSNPEVFIDSFTPGLEYYPYEGSVLNAFSVDTNTFFGNRGASMRFDIPNVGDPRGAFAGAIFKDENGGRNLTSYNALTFYAKATRAGTINDIGFGQDFEGNEFEVSKRALRLTTNWRKYTIPIPNPSVLTASKGMFWYAEGPEDGEGYSFWVDELRYEFIEDLAQPRASILGGQDVVQTSFIGSNTQITDLSFTANLPTGEDVTVAASPSYFTFNSSNPLVATVDNNGRVTILGTGEAIIRGSLDGKIASGSLTIDSQGEFVSAPIPTEDPSNVISIFSDVYPNIPVDFYNGFYAPFQTTTSNDFSVNGDNVLAYENFNFVGIEFRTNVPTIDATNMTHLSLHIFIPNPVPAGSAFRTRIVNNVGLGTQASAETTIFANSGATRLEQGEWIRILVPLSGLSNRSNLGQIIFDSDLGPPLGGATIWVDNIYLFNANAGN